MKIAPIVRELRRDPSAFSTTLVHTGQHYDAAMSDIFFDQLGIPHPDVDLGVGSSSHSQQTATIMSKFEPLLIERAPDVVLVVGDVNSTIACALVASKLGVKIAHVEAGLRSNDRTMPEEINRVLTDQISDLLFTTEREAATNLVREGVAADKIHFVGNVMIDTLLAHRERALASFDRARLGFPAGDYGLMTLHRPSNVDHADTFERVMTGISHVARDLPFVFPVHPRTRPAITRSATARALLETRRLTLLDPLGYLEFLGAMASSTVVLTDSGGVQEETTVLGVPCLTLRENTERPVTITHGTNQLVGNDPARVAAAWDAVKANPPKGRMPELWDGRAAERIAGILRTVGA